MAIKVKNEFRLTMGPVLFNWSPDKWRDFYFRIADEAPVDVVYVGEVVCSKRAPFFEPVIPDVLQRLQNAKKEIVLSSLAMVMNKREVQCMRDLTTDTVSMVEANDVSALLKLSGRPHVIGPYINVYNESTFCYLAQRGAKRICLSPELPFNSMRPLIDVAREFAAEIEVQVFGRMPLALSSRCYHARAHKLSKDNCQFVCGKDTEGMLLHTLDDQPFLAVNGIQTLSDACLNLFPEINVMKEAGIRFFRLSPQDCDMVKIASLHRDVLDQKISAQEACHGVYRQLPRARFSNGYFHGQPGHGFENRKIS